MKKSFKKMGYLNVKMCVLIVLFISISKLTAQDTLWTRTYGGIYNDVGSSVIEISSGGFLIAGHTQSFGAGSEDVYLIRTDDDGNTLWTKTYGGNNGDKAYSVIEVSSDGFLIAGYTTSYGAGSSDVYLIRTDANGDTLWTRTYGGTSNDEGRDVIEVSSGGFLIAGTTGSFGNNGTDFWLIRTDSIGNTLWSKTYDGGEDDWCYSVCESSSGGFIVTGLTYRSGGAYKYVWLIRTDDNGTTIWENTYGESGAETGHAVIECTDGDYVIAGTSWNQSNGSFDVYLIKTDDNGNTLWTKMYGGTGSDNSYSVAEVSSGRFIIVGETLSFGAGGGDVYLIRTDASGDTLWTRTYGGIGDDWGYSVIPCSSNGFAITGYTGFGAGSIDVWLLRVNDQPVNDINDEPKEQVPQSYSLEQNYPNPFNPNTTIRFSIPEPGIVQIKVFDLLGKEIKTLLNEYKQTGSYEVDFEAGDLPGGIYLYRMKSSGYLVTKKMLLLK